MIDDRSLVRGWPAALVDIAEVIGVPAALHLVDAYGGTVLTVPAHADPAHHLVQAIGPAAAGRLAAAFGRIDIEIPVLRGVRTRKDMIADASGTTKQVARALGVTTRYVRMVRNAPTGGDARQMDMFAAPVQD